MARIRNDIKKHVPSEKLDESLRKMQHRNDLSSKKIYNRILFIKLRYLGNSVEEAAGKIKTSRATGYRIQKLWNDGGIDALCPLPIHGRPSRITDEEKENIKRVVSKTPMETKDVRLFIKKNTTSITQ